LPEVPTVAESGVPRFEVSTWFGIVAPRGTPEDVVARLNAVIGSAMHDKSFRDTFEAVGLIIPQPMKPAEFSALIAAEGTKWAPLVKAKKIVLD
jgi:tripartite-type tricarboxylate transporter receptor subunit TctC